MSTTTLPDCKNPEFLFSCTDSDLLVKILSGQINPKEAARKELENRGLDKNGLWVGFKRKK